MTITVTQHHIDNKLGYSGDKCPVALAIQEAMPGTYVYVGITKANIGDTSVWLPEAVTKWISDFCRKRPVAPITFEL